MYKHTVYLDIDGVLADFNEQWKKYKSQYHPAAAKYSIWEIAIIEKIFEHLNQCSNAQKLLSNLESLPVNLELLGSLGGGSFSSEVESQKLKWLKDNNIHYKPNFVKDKSQKQNFADPYKILIDDTKINIEQFNAAGGFGIFYSDDEWEDAIEQIKRILYENP